MTDEQSWYVALDLRVRKPLRIFLHAACRVGWEAAEDLTQETLKEAWTKRRLLVEHECLDGWVFDAARKKAANLLRTHAVSRTGPLGEQLDVLLAAGPDLELLLAVRAAVWSLPQRQREVVTLRYLLEYSVRETALLLGIAEGTVTGVAADARKALAAPLAEHVGGAGEGRHG